ncbi:hypothetical protein FRC07_012609 [Ceratobasidium sp. 392]|nr:hypothetical protein FRC07_012609 [Ceratobasidium sp. 392]
MGVTPITSAKQFNELINQDKPIVIDFWATWCGPCRQISPKFEAHSTSEDKVEFYKVDVDEQPDIAAAVGVRAMPTFSAFKKGEKIGEVTGAFPDKLKALVETAVAAA